MKVRVKEKLSAWLLLSVFVPMVVLSSLHVHPDQILSTDTCHLCIDHVVHNGHISAIKAHVDCPLCAFQSSVFQPGKTQHIAAAPQLSVQLDSWYAPAIVTDNVSDLYTRGPPHSFCA